MSASELESARAGTSQVHSRPRCRASEDVQIRLDLGEIGIS